MAPGCLGRRLLGVGFRVYGSGFRGLAQCWVFVSGSAGSTGAAMLFLPTPTFDDINPALPVILRNIPKFP